MTYNKLSMIAIAIALASCSVVPEVEESPVAPGNKVNKEITLTAFCGEPETRTVRESDGSVLWSPGDEISLFYGSGSEGGSKFTAQNTEKAKVVNFRGEIGVITGGNDVSVEDTYFWATYPYCAEASCDGNSITTVLPSAQLATADTFADDLFPSIGRSQGLNMGFYNICGGIKFTVASEGIKSVTLRSNGGELIAGKITVGFDENGIPVVTNIVDGKDYVTLTAPAGETLEVGRAYFLVFIPTVFENGFTLTFSKGYAQAVKERTSKTTIRRSVFGTMNTPDKDLEWDILYVPIPDDNFHAYMIQNFDTNGNGELDFDEAEAVTRIVVCTDDIASVQGIEYCPNLKKLVCSGSGSILDGENIVQIGKGQLATLDVSHNAALTSLDCSCNRLTGLNVSQNSALSSLYFDRNQLTSIDVSNNTSLIVLQSSNNQLTSLDVSQNTSLVYLYCESNKLTSLDLSANSALVHLQCAYNQLTGLDMSSNTALNYLSCYSNKLSSLNVSANMSLTSLSCENNKLSALDVSSNTKLTNLICSGNQLSSIDVRANTALTDLGCGYNQLTSLDISANTALTTLYCHANQLTSLDLSTSTSLIHLYCWGNMLSTLDVSANTAIQSLYCSPMNDATGANLLEYLYIADGQQIPGVTVDRNDSYVPDETIVTPHCVIMPDANFRAYMIQNFDTNGNGYLDFDEAEAVTRIEVNTDNITSLQGIEYCTNLQYLRCKGSGPAWDAIRQSYIGNGQLSSLDISSNTALTTLMCDNNQLTSLDLKSNLALANVSCDFNQLTSIDLSQNIALQILRCFGNKLTTLDISANTALTKINCGGNQLTSLNVSDNTALTELYCGGNHIASIDITHNNALEVLDCSDNQLTTLDVSSKAGLKELNCCYNQLTALDVSQNTLLNTLYCYNNQLTNLDVSKNTALEVLSCHINKLTVLDVSQNSLLKSLYCYSNQLTSLDVSKNTALNSMDCSPMNDVDGNNLLGYIYIAQGQQITGVTVDRSVDKVPAETGILVAPESGGSEGTSDENLD